jgi:fermentation-respiration switch protein FrsA (DUF1100 family)
LALAISYLIVLFMLAFFQRSLIYLPSRAPRIEAADAGLGTGRVSTVTLDTDDGLRLRGWYVLPDGSPTGSLVEDDVYPDHGGPVILYFSGNAGNRAYRTQDFELLAELGCHVLVFDYRGYGDNAGSPSEERLAADAHAVWRYAAETRGIAADRLILLGESLGGGVAVRLAAELSEAGTPPGGLILRATFSSLVDAAAYHYPWLPVRLLMIDRFPSADRIPRVTCPILHIHGSRDQIVPIQLGRKLHAAAREQSSTGIAKRFVQLPNAGHNDILLVAEDEFRQAVGEFLQRIGPSVGE